MTFSILGDVVRTLPDGRKVWAFADVRIFGAPVVFQVETAPGANWYDSPSRPYHDPDKAEAAILAIL